MKIKIGIWSMFEQISVLADDVTKEFNINQYSNVHGVEDFVRDAIAIVRDWPDLIEDKNMRDGVNYKIVYDDGNIVRELIGSHDVLDNYVELVDLIKRYNPDNEDYLAEEERLNAALSDNSGCDF